MSLIFITTQLLGVIFIVVFGSVLDGLQHPILRNAGRVVGGQRANQKDFPFLVSIQKFSAGNEYVGGTWFHVCGGSILNPRWILTACHCLAFTSKKPLQYKNPKKYRIVAGVTDLREKTLERQEIRAQEFIAHPKCNRGGFFTPYTYYDAGLIMIQRPLRYSLRVKPLALFNKNPNESEMMVRRLQHVNARCLSPGWGRVGQLPKVKRSPQLKVAIQTLRTAEQCHDILCGGENASYEYEGKCMDLNEIDQVCVTSNDASVCKGDSGGPLVCHGYVVGVVSQVGSSCKFGGMQIFSGIRSILNIVNKYVTRNESIYNDYADLDGSGNVSSEL